MGIKTAVVRELMAAGLEGEALLEALERIEQSEVPSKSSAAVRQQRYRDKKASRVTSRYAVAETQQTVTRDVTLRNSDEGHIYTSLDKNKKKDYMRASRLSDAWSLSDVDRQWALQRGISDSEIKTQVERFRDYWVAKPGKDGVKLNWSSTWRNWCRNFLERAGRPTEPAKEVSSGEWIQQGTEEWEAWRYFRGKPFPVDRNGGWHVASRWPASRWPEDDPEYRKTMNEITNP